MTRLPRSPGSTLVLRLNQETVHDFVLLFLLLCGLLRWIPGPSNQAYLSSPHLKASPVMTFRACSSPAPTPVKPQLAPALLSQESVHTMLSITHHTRKWASTGPRTTHGPQSPLDECIDNTQDLVTREKRKRKETNKRIPQQGIESQRKAKSKITWRRQISDPLGKSNGSTHSRQNHAQSKSANHQSKARTMQRAPTTHMQAPHEPKHTPPEPIQQCNMEVQQTAKNYSLCPRRLDRLRGG
jgi:hypothetical protein